MYHPQSGHMSRPPSPRPTHLPLSIRTTITPTEAFVTHDGRSSSPQPQPAYPNYPVPISTEKFKKALMLYTKWYLEQGLAQRMREPQSAIEPNNRLSIPNVKRAHSLSSPASSRPYTASVSDSLYDGVTETVVSFTGDDTPGSATLNGGSELVNFKNERVQQRYRRRLAPVARAKAALIRHLKACSYCSKKRVPCALDHHDIGSLERARQAKARKRAQSVAESSQSLNGSSSSRPTSLLPPGESNAVASQGQSTSLFGVGGGIGQTNQFDPFDQFQVMDIPSLDAVHNESQSSAYAPEADLLSAIPIHRAAVAGTANLAPQMPPMPYSDPYSDYQDGQIFPLGVRRGFFYFCAHLDSVCHHPFEDAEALQAHFETHFAYNRIAPAHRLVCQYCQTFNNSSSGRCYNCGNEGPFETWVYGNFIRTPDFQHYGPDGQDFLRNNSSAPFFPGMGTFGMGDDIFGLGGMDSGDGNFTTDGVNQGGFYNFQDDCEEPGSHGANDGYTTPRSGGFLQGDWARQAKASPLNSRYWYAKCRHHKLLLLTLLFLVALTLPFKAHDRVLIEALTDDPIFQSADNPALGFVCFLTSFAMCYTCWSLKTLPLQRVGEARCRLRPPLLHDLATISFHHRQTAPTTDARGAAFA